LLRASAPLSADQESIQTAEEIKPENVWVAVEDMADVLLVSGIKDVDAATGFAQFKFKNKIIYFYF
jgi:hypothetical protein